MIAKLRTWWTRTGVIAREIVAKRVTIATGAGAIVGVLVDQDVLPSGVGAAATEWLGKGLIIVGVVTGVFWARRGTTPADPALQPVDTEGRRLVPAGSIAAVSAPRHVLDDSTPEKHDALE